jgi:hypothetical protein
VLDIGVSKLARKVLSAAAKANAAAAARAR